MGKRILIIALICIIAFLIFNYSFNTRKFSLTDKVLENPYIGFVPSADYDSIVGDNRLVYFDITWRELEPQEGEFNFDAIEEENNIAEWKSAGKNAIFRFVCDIPGDEKHMDIPEWLYEKTGDGAFYGTSYGRGYAPNYSNPEFIKYHAKAIEALGKRYGGDDFIYCVQLGSLGHWGEWHINRNAPEIPRIPTVEVRQKYTEVYRTAFPNAYIMLRRPFMEIENGEYGFFNDMTGDKDETERWLNWFYEGGVYKQTIPEEPLLPLEGFWKENPIGGEFTSGTDMEYMLTDNFEETLELLERSHQSFIGPKIPLPHKLPENCLGAIDVLKTKLGYRFTAANAYMLTGKIIGGTHVWVKLENIGNAPIYREYFARIYMLNSDGDIVFETDTIKDVSEITGGGEAYIHAYIPQTLDGNKIGLAVENPNDTSDRIALDTDAAENERIYTLF